jgi:transposase
MTCAALVMEAIELNGMKRCQASDCFGISRNTIQSVVSTQK